MGLFNIYRLCASVLFASAMIFFAVYSVSVSAAVTGNNNYFYNAPTKSWIPTSSAVITPQGTVINNSAAAQSHTSLSNGGFSNKTTITANFPTVKKTVPITINARVTPAAVKSAAKTVLKGGAATIVLGAGLNSLLNGLGWVMGEGGKVQKIVKSEGPPQGVPDGYHIVVQVGIGSQSSACPVRSDLTCYPAGAGGHMGYLNYYCWNQNGGQPLTGSVQLNSGYANCYYGGSLPAPQPVPVSDDDIDSGVNSNYSPSVDDYPALAPYLPPSSTLIDPIPQVDEPPTTVTVTDLDTGKTTTTQTNIWHNFDVSKNPSAAPQVDVKTTEDTKTYTDGQLTGTSTKTQTSEADPNQSSVGGAVPPPEIPTDCDFHPTLCAWMDWTKQNDLDDEPDLKAIMHDFEPSNTNFTVSGAKSCPAPYSIHIALIDKTVELSFEPACTFAGYLYFFVMAGAYVFAAYITLGVARNG